MIREICGRSVISESHGALEGVRRVCRLTAFTHRPREYVTLDSPINRDGPRLSDVPSQFPECRPHGFAKILRIFSLDPGLQRLTRVETAFGQSHEVIVLDHLVLVGPSSSRT